MSAHSTSPFVQPPNRQCQLFVASGACKDEDESRRKDQLNKKTRRSPKIPDVGHTGVSFDDTLLCGSTAFSLFLLPSTIKRLDLGCSSMCLAGALQKRCKNTAGTSDMALPGGTLPRIEPSTHHKSHWTGQETCADASIENFENSKPANLVFWVPLRDLPQWFSNVVNLSNTYVLVFGYRCLFPETHLPTGIQAQQHRHPHPSFFLHLHEPQLTLSKLIPLTRSQLEITDDCKQGEREHTHKRISTVA